MAFAYTNTWDETSPADTEKVGDAAKIMREMKVDLRESFEHARWKQTELVNAHGETSGAISIDFDDGNVHEMTLTGDMTTLTVTDSGETFADFDGRLVCITLIIHQDETGERAIVYPSGAIWPYGTEPVLDDTAETTTDISMWTIDGGTTWHMALLGTGMEASS